jgi:hypothetical protein
MFHSIKFFSANAHRDSYDYASSAEKMAFVRPWTFSLPSSTEEKSSKKGSMWEWKIITAATSGGLKSHFARSDVLR